MKKQNSDARVYKIGKSTFAINGNYGDFRIWKIIRGRWTVYISESYETLSAAECAILEASCTGFAVGKTITIAEGKLSK